MTVVKVVSCMVSVSDNELVGYPEIQKLTGLPVQTARRYAATFDRWIPSRTVGRATKFPREAIPIFERIREAFEAGRTTIEVKDMLSADTHPILDVDPPSVPAQAPDRTSPPALPDTLGQLLPVLDRLATSFERLVGNQERILEEMKLTREAIQAAQGPQDAPKASGDINPHPERETGQESPLVKVVVNRDAVIARVMELSAQGLGQHAIMTRIRREGLRMSPRGEISKSTVARIIKGDIK